MPFVRKRARRPAYRSRVAPLSPMLKGEDDRPTATRKGLPDRPSRPTDSMIIAREAAAPFNAYADVQENHKDHIIPRQSLTDRQLLGLVPMVEYETIDKVTYQLDRMSGELVKTSDPAPRVSWRRDKTLLRKVRVERIESLKVKRETARSKRLITEVAAGGPACIEVEDLLDDINLLPPDPEPTK